MIFSTTSVSGMEVAWWCGALVVESSLKEGVAAQAEFSAGRQFHFGIKSYAQVSIV